MNELLSQSSLWAVLLTAGAYQLGLYLRKKTGSNLCNPILVAALVIIACLLGTGVSQDAYQSGMKNLSWLLTPGTVCLAIPLYTQLDRLKGSLKAILGGVAAGTLASLVLIGGMGLVFGLEDQVAVSLLPKSITTAMAIPLAQNAGGLVPLTTAAVILTGVLGAAAGQGLCKLFGIRDPIAQGVAFGTASHVIGTSRATELDPLAGAVGSLSLVVAGILTAVLFPMFMG